MQYAGRSEFCGPREVWEPLGKKRRKPSKAEKLLGLHVKVTKEARAEQMQVVYSTQYYETKNQEIPDDAFPENPNPKYIGTVVECDPDGLMTNVKWQDGSVEYCCTGYSKKYFLALVDDEAEGSDKMKSSEKMDWAEFAARCPKWTGTPHGMYAVPFKTSHRLIKDMTTVAMEVKRLHTRMSRAMPGSVAQQQIHEEFLIAKQELQEMNSEREQMASWMEFTIGDEKFRIPPSSLAPPASASLGTKQPCILSQILKEVRRDAEKERRRRRREEEAEVERKRLERKSIRSTIYADELKQHNKRQVCSSRPSQIATTELLMLLLAASHRGGGHGVSWGNLSGGSSFLDPSIFLWSSPIVRFMPLLTAAPSPAGGLQDGPLGGSEHRLTRRAHRDSEGGLYAL